MSLIAQVLAARASPRGCSVSPGIGATLNLTGQDLSPVPQRPSSPVGWGLQEHPCFPEPPFCPDAACELYVEPAARGGGSGERGRRPRLQLIKSRKVITSKSPQPAALHSSGLGLIFLLQRCCTYKIIITNFINKEITGGRRRGARHCGLASTWPGKRVPAGRPVLPREGPGPPVLWP